MIKVEKAITIHMDGEDIEVLLKVCSAARAYMDDCSDKPSFNWRRGESVVGQFSGQEARQIAQFLATIFDI